MARRPSGQPDDGQGAGRADDLERPHAAGHAERDEGRRDDGEQRPVRARVLVPDEPVVDGFAHERGRAEHVGVQAVVHRQARVAEIAEEVGRGRRGEQEEHVQPDDRGQHPARGQARPPGRDEQREVGPAHDQQQGAELARGQRRRVEDVQRAGQPAREAGSRGHDEAVGAARRARGHARGGGDEDGQGGERDGLRPGERGRALAHGHPRGDVRASHGARATPPRHPPHGPVAAVFRRAYGASSPR